MRSRFSIQINDIHKELVEMGTLIENALESAMTALTDGSAKRVEKTRKYEFEIDEKEKMIELMCMRVLSTQQPVAGDLRLVSAALKMITDMERVGDQAEDIADIALVLDRNEPYDFIAVNAMFEVALKMLKESISAFVRADLELAKSVIAGDDAVDGYFISIRNELITRIKTMPSAAEQAVDLIMVIKYLERVGDHACNIAEWVIYTITGEHKGHGDDIRS
jgi:phosphate transport system protein